MTSLPAPLQDHEHELDRSFVSFVVIAYNEASNIARTIASIVNLDGLLEYELIVVNDGSRDSTGQIVAAIAASNPRIHLINLAENCGRGYARNKGIRATSGELIATVDSDILLPPDWLVRARRALRMCDAVGGTAVPDGDVSYVYKAFGLVPRPVSHTTAVTGSNALYRNHVFLATGFDAALKEGEDSALNRAMNHQGFTCTSIPGLQVRHEESKPLGTSLRWLFEVGKGATRQLLTYRELRQPDIVCAAFYFCLSLGLVIAVFGNPLFGAGCPVGFVAVASTQHIRSKFETPRQLWLRVAAAIVVDAVLLTAYFAGRVAGLFSACIYARRHLSLRKPSPETETADHISRWVESDSSRACEGS